MSYILDALKKSETERRAGVLVGLPAATTYVVASENPSGRRGLAILSALAMLGAGLGLGAWRPWQEAVQSEPVRVVAAPAAAPAPAEPTATPPPPAPAAEPVAPPPEEAAIPSPVAVPPEKPPEAQARPRAAARSRQAARDAAPVVSPPVVRIPRAAETAEPGKGVVSYGELPADVRDGLPPIAFGGYAGTDEEDKRIAFINHRLVKEGEEVSPGVRLEEVGPHGVVLGYRGYRFRPGP